MITDNYFIVWSCGFEYLTQIFDIIREHKDIKITRIFRKSFSFNSDFFKELYKLDKRVSNELINLKTTYLKKFPPEIFIIFVKDFNTKYLIKNDDFKYSENITFLKWKIRLLFNPRDKNTPFCPNVTDSQVKLATVQKWWYAGVSHNHIIHSNDLHKETSILINYFKLNNQDFSLQGNCFYNLPKKITKVKIDDILCNTLNKTGVHITETPFYTFLLGKREEYDKYILSKFGTVITYDNLSGAYDKLIKNFNYGIEIDGIPQYITATRSQKIYQDYERPINKFQALDGGHRLAILYHKGIREINIWEIL